MKQTNQNQRNRIRHEGAQQLVHGLLDAEMEYALKVNQLAQRWFAMTLRKEDVAK